MTQAASDTGTTLATYDARPFFARSLDHGLRDGIIGSDRLDAMRADGAKGIVQIADFFGTSHLRTDLDGALKRMVNLASLYLEHISDGNLTRAARSLQENTFLSHSRGASQMLKALHAMPTDTIILDASEDAEVREFLRARSLAEPWSVAEYRARLAERKGYQAEIDTALWFADAIGLSHEALLGESADGFIQACLLTRIAGRAEGSLLSAKELKAFLKSFRAAKTKRPVRKDLLDDVPEVYRPLAARHLATLVKKDLKRIIDPKVPFADLVRDYHDRFHPFSMHVEVADYEELLTDEWRKVTRGKSDTDSMNTIFLCLAAGRPPKPAITATEARAAIRAIRKDGVLADVVPAFIRRSAPHQMVDGLLSLWEDEFVPEVIEQAILDDDDDALEPTLRILAQHCHITSPATKKR